MTTDRETTRSRRSRGDGGTAASTALLVFSALVLVGGVIAYILV